MNPRKNPKRSSLYGLFLGAIPVYLFAVVDGSVLVAAKVPVHWGAGGVQPAVLCLGGAERRGGAACAGGAYLAGRSAAGKTAPQKAAAYPADRGTPGRTGGI